MIKVLMKSYYEYKQDVITLYLHFITYYHFIYISAAQVFDSFSSLHIQYRINDIALLLKMQSYVHFGQEMTSHIIVNEINREIRNEWGSTCLFVLKVSNVFCLH